MHSPFLGAFLIDSIFVYQKKSCTSQHFSLLTNKLLFFFLWADMK